MTDDRMPGDDTATTDIVHAISHEPHAARMLPIMGDEDIRKTWRIAKSLAASGMFKDVTQAEKAFAKILIGRDLGLGPTQAMMGIDLVEGGIQLRAVLLARFIKATGRYTFRVRCGDEPARQLPPAVPTPVGAVYHHDSEHCLLDFYEREGGQWTWVGESSFSMDDARLANLVKAKGAWEKHPRNMLWARALSNGAKWHCSDALAGHIVYTEGDSFDNNVIASGDGEPAGIDLGPKVEALMERARRLGHAGFQDRGMLEMALGEQSPAHVDAFLAKAHKDMDAFEAEGAGVAEGEAVEETAQHA